MNSLAYVLFLFLDYYRDLPQKFSTSRIKKIHTPKEKKEPRKQNITSTSHATFSQPATRDHSHLFLSIDYYLTSLACQYTYTTFLGCCIRAIFFSTPLDTNQTTILSTNLQHTYPSAKMHCYCANYYVRPRLRIHLSRTPSRLPTQTKTSKTDRTNADMHLLLQGSVNCHNKVSQFGDRCRLCTVSPAQSFLSSHENPPR